MQQQQQQQKLGVIYRPPNTDISELNEKINCRCDKKRKEILLYDGWL